MATESNPSAPVEILLVEDDPGDVLMTKEALKESKLLHRLHVVRPDCSGRIYPIRAGAPRGSLIRGGQPDDGEEEVVDLAHHLG